jgi:spermidine synthase
MDRGLRKYHGSIVHRSQDRFGIIEIVEDGLTRSLHFGNAVRQSAMDLARPEYLMLAYTRAMISGLVFQPSPRHVLLIGLGGGSLAKFLLHHFPQCIIDAVEHREQIVKLAHGYFLLPENPRLRIHIADGDMFARNAASVAAGRYDLILADAYDGAGIADNMGQAPFFASCRDLLTADGVLVNNLWGNDRPRYTQIRRRLRDCFGTNPLLLPAEGTTNVIAMALRRAGHKKLLKTAESRAKPLETQTDVEFVRLTRTLRKQNYSLMNLLFP